MGRMLVVWALLTTPVWGKDLFNGKDLKNWNFVGRHDGASDSGGFVVENGTLKSAPGKGILVYTREKLGNGIIHLEYMMSTDTGNSGLFIRIPEIPTSEDTAINKGIEVQIDNRDNEWHRTGVLYSMTKAMASPGKGAGEWNTMDITLDGLRTIVKVNGTLVTDYDGVSAVPPKVKPYEPDRGPRPEKGYVALQKHDDTSVFTFRKITWTAK